MIKVAILGASGYTGAELIRLLDGHDGFRITALGADRKAGMKIDAVFPHLRHLDLPVLSKIAEINFDAVDLCFCALPHAMTHKIVRDLPKHLKIIDLSADFRLRDPAAFEKWYGKPHTAQEAQKTAVYGLTEFYRDELRGAQLVAGTGCNAALGQYVLRPLISAGVIDLSRIILDMKCGVSGAGRGLKENLLHSELSEGYHAYGMGGTHRHLGEFDQEFSALAGRDVHVQFSAHLIPANRGILATAYVDGDASAMYTALQNAYQNEPFITLLPMGETPSTHHVRGSNYVHIGVVQDRHAGRAQVVGVLDNLVKGSSGQALQNANLLYGYDETQGLTAPALFP